MKQYTIDQIHRWLRSYSPATLRITISNELSGCELLPFTPGEDDEEEEDLDTKPGAAPFPAKPPEGYKAYAS